MWFFGSPAPTTTAAASPCPGVAALPGRSSPSANARQTTQGSAQVWRQDRCTEQGLSSKSSLRVAHQHPAYGHGWQSRAVHQTAVAEATSTLRSPLPYQLSTVAGTPRWWKDPQRRPKGLGDVRPSGAVGPSARLCAVEQDIVERCVQAQASNERHRLLGKKRRQLASSWRLA